MATCIGSITASVAFASPNEGRRVPIPAFNGLAKPLFEQFHIIDMMPLERSSLDDALHGLSHIEPGASVRRAEEHNALLSTPLGDAWALVSGQIIPDQQHPHWRQKPIQLLGCGVDIPILPASSLWNDFWSWWALLQNRREVLFEPGMQDGVGRMVYWFGSQFSGGRPNQSEQFGWQT